MNIPGLLIEYLITGSIALIWIIPFLNIFGISLVTYTSLLGNIISLVAIPFIYIVGLSLDMITTWIIMKLECKKKIKEKIDKEFEKHYPKEYKKIENREFSIENIWLYSSEIGKGYETRSSRDRIARGTVLNFIIAAFIIPICAYPSILSFTSLITFIIFLVLSGLFYLIWKECEARTYRYRLYILRLILELEENQKNKN
ncbi:MAG: hypothetical protein AB4057_02150 [Crocosphaera sp.]